MRSIFVRRRRQAILTRVVMSKKTLKYLLNGLLLVLILGGTMFFLLRNQELETIFHHIHMAKKPYLLAGVGFVLIFIFSESAVMHILLNSFSDVIGYLKCTCLSCCGFFYSAITPGASGGQPIQIFYMTKCGVDMLVGTLVCMIVTIFYKSVLLLLCLAFFIAKPDVMTMAVSKVPLLFIYGISGNVLFLIFLLLAVFKPSIAYSIVSALIKLGGRLHILKHPEQTLSSAMNSLKQYERGADYLKRHLLILPKIFIITLIQRLSFFMVCFMVYKSFGLAGTTVLDFIALQVVLAISVDVLPLPGAAGANESVFVILFKHIFGNVAVLSGLLLYRGLTYFFMLILTALVTFVFHIVIMRTNLKEKKGREMEC